MLLSMFAVAVVDGDDDDDRRKYKPNNQPTNTVNTCMEKDSVK